MTEAELERKHQREEAAGVAAGRARGGAAARRARVAKSRQAAEAARRRGRPAAETPAEETPAEETPAEEAPVEEAPVEEAPVEEASVEAEDADAEDVVSDADTDAELTEDDLYPYGEGSHVALEDDSQPEGYPIKGNANSMLYHTPDSPFYGRTVADVWFATEEAAEEAGFSKPASQQKDEE
jgi:hypothetical protein